MRAKMIDVMPGVFLRYNPISSTIPLIVDVSRSGREYPHDFRSPASFTDVHDNASMYVEELWDHTPAVGGTLLYACFPNTYIDVNRAELDIDASLIEGEWPTSLQPSDFTTRGLGLLKKVTRYGQPMHERKFTVEEVQERVRRFYRPYHAELHALITQAQARFGRVWQLSCHCMSAVGAPTHPDKGQERADVCLGNLGGVSSGERIIEALRKAFEAEGYSVSVNFPYKGGELNRRYGDPKHGVESILVELNKKLFMDTKTFRKTETYAKLHQGVTAVLEAVGAYVRKECQLPAA